MKVTGIKVLTHRKKTPPHFRNAQNAPKKKEKKVRQNPKKAKNPVPTRLKMSKTHLIGHTKLTH
jgi:hypothetical protein